MLDLNSWQEIFVTIKKNKLRTFLTGFSVFWGIFMLIILLGSGSGLENAVLQNFNQGAINSVWIGTGRTTISHEGMKPGRRVQMRDEDYELTKKLNPEIEEITSRFEIYFNTVLRYGTKTAEYGISSARESDIHLEQGEMVMGRFISPTDLKKNRKVTVISPIVRKYFFEEDEDPLGKYIIANGIAFKVVGVFKDASERNQYRIFIPTTTAQKLYNGHNKVNTIGMTIKDMNLKELGAFEERLRAQISKRHKISTEDKRALRIHNNFENYKETLNVFLGIRVFIWIIGILSIVASIIGVANIMLITVKERTKEIGVRKAIGATPGSIIRIVLFEAIMITSLFGYIGLFLGTLIIELISTKMPPNDFFYRPEVNLLTAIGATLLLILAGTLAGYYPANKAAKIKPIVALRDE